jgi:hypothetical protein
VQALQEALSRYGKPDIFNTDQGSQFIHLYAAKGKFV